MKNILFIHSSSELYGSDRSLLNIIKNLDRSKFSIHVVLPCQGPLVEEMMKLPDVKVSIFEIAVLRRKNFSPLGLLAYAKDFFKSFFFVIRYIKTNKIDIVDTNTAVVFPGAVAAKFCRKKSVWHIREIIKSRIENKVISFVMRLFSDIVVANSKATGKALCVPQEKIQVVYNAVGDAKFDGLIERNSSKIIVGMAGRINRWKGQKLFVDAAEIVAKQKPNVSFEIAGDVYQGEDFIREDLISYIKEKKLNQIVLLDGLVQDMPSFYRKLDVFVLPSLQPEPFGLVVIEAMSYGLPVIATNHGGPTEIIEDGKDGYLVRYDKANDMANRILELVNDREKRIMMGSMGRKKKAELFSVPVMVRKMESVFLKV